jgi:hypothetical protein
LIGGLPERRIELVRDRSGETVSPELRQLGMALPLLQRCGTRFWRDPKGLCKKASRGKFKNFAGLGLTLRAARHFDLIFDARNDSADKLAGRGFYFMERRGVPS